MRLHNIPVSGMGWVGPWPGRGPFSHLPPWQRPGWLFGRGACWWLFRPFWAYWGPYPLYRPLGWPYLPTLPYMYYHPWPWYYPYPW